MPFNAVVCRNNPDVDGPWTIPNFFRGSVLGRRSNRCIAHSGPASPGLAPEKDRLRRAGLSIRGLFYATIRAYAAAISSCHKGFGNRPFFSHPLVKQLLQGVRRQWLVAHVSSPPWELFGAQGLGDGSLRASGGFLLLLLALFSSAKRVYELTALSVNPC